MIFFYHYRASNAKSSTFWEKSKSENDRKKTKIITFYLDGSLDTYNSVFPTRKKLSF